MTDLRSVGDLAAVSYDAGVQLGTGRLHDRTVLLSAYDRNRLLAATGKLEKRYRQEASNKSMTCSKDGASSQKDESIGEIETGARFRWTRHVLLFTVAAALGSPFACV